MSELRRFRNLLKNLQIGSDFTTSDLISPRLEINSDVEPNKAARDFTASIALACKLSTRKLTPSELNSDLPGLDRLLKQKQGLRKLCMKSGIQRVNRQLTGSRKQKNVL
jgi:hypothetical protein